MGLNFLITFRITTLWLFLSGTKTRHHIHLCTIACHPIEDSSTLHHPAFQELAIMKGLINLSPELVSLSQFDHIQTAY